VGGEDGHRKLMFAIEAVEQRRRHHGSPPKYAKGQAISWWTAVTERVQHGICDRFGDTCT
jgi:hypothetical protein